MAKKKTLTQDESLTRLIQFGEELGCDKEVIRLLQQDRLRHAAVQRNVKDSIFTDLFSKQPYLMWLYQELHPEDKTVTEADIRLVTLKNTLVNGLRNDLGFTVRDRTIILQEAQSTFTENIVVRLFWYLADSWQRHVYESGQAIHGKPKIDLQEPELYVLFPNQQGPEWISLADEFLSGRKDFVDFKVKCMYGGEKGKILDQYTQCAKICDEEIAHKGRTYVETAIAIKERCLDQGVLVEYMRQLAEGELANMVGILSEAEEQERAVAASWEAGRITGQMEGKTEGRIEGRIEGKIEGKIELLTDIADQFGHDEGWIISQLQRQFNVDEARAAEMLGEYRLAF